jgi:AraC family transcriptional regulator
MLILSSDEAVTVTSARAVGAFGFETLRYAPASVVPSYTHDGFNLCLVVTGGCTEMRDGATHHYRGPALTVNVPSTRQEFRIGPDGATCFSIDLPLAWISDLREGDEGRDRGARIQAGTSPAVNLRDPMRVSAALRLRHVLDSTEDLPLIAIEEALIGLLDGMSQEPPTAGAAPAWLRRVLERINDAPAAAADLETLARGAGVHRVHLARSFRRYYGRSIGEHIRERRVWLAQSQMANDAAALGRIGLRAGFYDQSHFNRRFREATGMTPGQFRELARRG